MSGCCGTDTPAPSPRGTDSPLVIAVAGKGGTGKTTISSLLARQAVEAGKKILAVDADPPISLAYALGAEPRPTVGELRWRIITDPEEKRRIGDQPMREVIIAEALQTLPGLSLLVVGQGEGAGCYCGLNELLKYGIESLAGDYDVVVIDCEAGIEQINRRVISSVDVLLMVSDPTMKGVRTAVHLRDIALKHGVSRDHRCGLVFNRVSDGVGDLPDRANELGLEVWGQVPADPQVAAFDLEGRPTMELSGDAMAVRAVKELAKTLGL
jgi:CO dehydrogenase maturation factor